MTKFKVGDQIEDLKGNIGVIESIGVDTIRVNFHDDTEVPMRPEEIIHSKTCMTDNGKEVSIKHYQWGLRNWPHNMQRYLDDDGRAGIINATYASYPCGCRVTGMGTLQFPIKIEFCAMHEAGFDAMESIKKAIIREQDERK